MPRIALIHALSHSVAPINAAMERDWPAAVRMNLLDDSLSADLAAGRVTLEGGMQRRFDQLADYARETGADAILFTCSAFGPCIESVARRLSPIPVLKPNEAMIADAAGLMARSGQGGSLGLLSTFAPTLVSMPREFPAGLVLKTHLVEGAMQALNAGDTETHDRLIAEGARVLAGQGCQALALAQFSMARARAVAEDATGLPVLTTPDSAVSLLKRLLA